METRRFGPMPDEVPVIGQGTWRLRDAGAAQQAIARGLDLGLTHLDTAEVYAGAEEALRPVMAGRRDTVFLVSKVQPAHASYRGTRAACRASLARLGVEALDVYLLHWPGPHPIEDTMRAMGDLIDEGLVRGAGVSNHDVEGMEQAMAALGGKRLVCNQVLYHLEERGIEHAVLPFCRERGIAVVGYSPFGSGRFPRQGGPGHRVLAEVGAKHDRTPRQVALRFLTREAPLFAIPKAERVAHVEENVGGQGFRLDDEDLERLDAAFPLTSPVAGVPTI